MHKLLLVLLLTACRPNPEDTQSREVPDPHVIFQAELSQAQLEVTNIELLNRDSTLSLLMGKESGPARLCLLGSIRVRNPLYDPITDVASAAWTTMIGPLLYETDVTVFGQSISYELLLDGHSLVVTGSVAQDWESMRITVPFLGSMRLLHIDAFPLCELITDDDSSP